VAVPRGRLHPHRLFWRPRRRPAALLLFSPAGHRHGRQGEGSRGAQMGWRPPDALASLGASNTPFRNTQQMVFYASQSGEDDAAEEEEEEFDQNRHAKSLPVPRHFVGTCLRGRAPCCRARACGSPIPWHSSQLPASPRRLALACGGQRCCERTTRFRSITALTPLTHTAD